MSKKFKPKNITRSVEELLLVAENYPYLFTSIGFVNTLCKVAGYDATEYEIRDMIADRRERKNV